MRTTLILLALVFAAHADWTITQKVEGGMNSGQMVLRIKDDKARLDVTTQITMLTDLKTGDAVTLDHNKRIFLRTAASEAAKVRDMTLGLKEGAAVETPKLVPTGRKEKVGDFDCEVFTWAIGEMKVTDWIGPGNPNLKDVLARFQNAGLARAAQPLMPPIESFPGMVIKREMNLRGTVTTTTVLSGKEGPLDPKLFDVPADYKAQPALQLPAK